jgi:hypothetical protein
MNVKMSLMLKKLRIFLVASFSGVQARIVAPKYIRRCACYIFALKVQGQNFDPRKHPKLPRDNVIFVLSTIFYQQQTQSWLKVQEELTARLMRGWNFPPPRRLRSIPHSSLCR